MKSYFILFCRIVGMVICCYSLLTILSTIPLFFYRPSFVGDMGSLQSLFGDSNWSRQISRDMQSFENDVWVGLLVSIFLSGILPFGFGFYLMKSGKWFIDLAYPESQKIETESDHSSSTPKPFRPDPDDRRFMPPGSR